MTPYAEGALAEMLALVRRGVGTLDPGDAPDAGWQHVGDVIWRLYQNSTIVPHERVHLVRDGAGELVGMIGAWPKAPFELFVPGDVADFDPLVRFMVRQIEGMVPAGATSLSLELPTNQARVAAIVGECGFQPSGDRPFFCNVQSLRGREMPESGHTVRPIDVTSSNEIDARVELHRQVWAPSKFTREGYDRLRRQPVYRPDLDLVAVTPDGELAAYTIVWGDPETRTGEFEPVGTDARFRGKGYGKAVVMEGLRRLQALGAERAVVLSSSDPEYAPANALYRSCGFETAFMLAEWTKRLA